MLLVLVTLKLLDNTPWLRQLLEEFIGPYSFKWWVYDCHSREHSGKRENCCGSIAENLHPETQPRGREVTGNPVGFWNLEAYPKGHISSSKVTPANSPQAFHLLQTKYLHRRTVEAILRQTLPSDDDVSSDSIPTYQPMIDRVYFETTKRIKYLLHFQAYWNMVSHLRSDL